MADIPDDPYSNEGGPAFPLKIDGVPGVAGNAYYYGMSYRRWLVGQALVGHLPSGFITAEKESADELARKALVLADSVIAALNEGAAS
jgi:hypothetical protein